MINKVNEEIMKALKAKDSFTANALKMLKAELQNAQKAKKQVSDLETAVGYSKKLSKSLDVPGIESKPEFVESVKRELAIIGQFLPKELSQEDLVALVQKHKPLGNTGAVMKAVKADVEAAGSVFDGKKVNEILRGMQ